MADAATTRENEKALKDVIRKFEETISKLETNVAIARCGISQSAETMITKILECEREAIDSVETTHAARLEKINSAKEKAESLLKQRFQELRDFEMPKHHETSFIKFTAASVEGLRLGDITTEGVDVSQCTLEGLHQILQAGVVAEFLLCPRTPEGEISNQPDLKNQIQVVFEPAEDVTYVIVNKDAENGKFKVNFTPKVPGAYKIEVKINDDKLPNCPFTTQVKERELVVVGELNLKLFLEHHLYSPAGFAVNIPQGRLQ